MVYGNHDAYTIADEAIIDPSTGERSAEARRYISFGLAHTRESLAGLRGAATHGRPLADLVPDAPDF